MIQTSETQLLLQFVHKEWAEIFSDMYRPQKVWIRQYQPMEYDIDPKLKTSIMQAWFMDARGIQERNVNEFSRFASAQIERPWSSTRDIIPLNPCFGKPHEFGMAAFVKFKNTDLHYMEVSWAYLYGCGYIVGLENGVMVVQKEVWKS